MRQTFAMVWCVLKYILAWEIINNIEDVCYILDSNARFVFVNEHARQVWGKSDSHGGSIWGEQEKDKLCQKTELKLLVMQFLR